MLVVTVAAPMEPRGRIHATSGIVVHDAVIDSGGKEGACTLQAWAEISGHRVRASDPRLWAVEQNAAWHYYLTVPKLHGKELLNPPGYGIVLTEADPRLPESLLVQRVRARVDPSRAVVPAQNIPPQSRTLAFGAIRDGVIDECRRRQVLHWFVEEESQGRNSAVVDLHELRLHVVVVKRLVGTQAA